MKYSIYRVISFATKSFVRNAALSFVTVIILLLALLSVNTLLTVRHLTTASVKAVEDRVDVRVQFYPDSDQKIIDEIAGTVRSLTQVKEIILMTSDEVREEFKKRHEKDEDIVAALNELNVNPFGFALIIKANTSKEYEEILSVINIDKYNKIIEQKTFGDHEAYIKQINTITKRATQFASSISIIFVVFSFFIIFNAIRVTMYSQREEIAIMRLVGASHWFIRAPFYLESLYYTFIAVFVSVAVTLLAVNVIDPYISQTFKTFSIYKEFLRQIPVIIFWEFFGVLALTILSASIAMRKYLRI